jgi:outer membrane protein OmpA-like peptidoglycan-associated protein
LGEIWIVVADVMLGFLLLVLIAFPRQQDTYEQPPAVAAFISDLIKFQRKEPIDFSPPRFAELNVTFRSDLLFKKCDWSLTDQGKERIDDFAQLLWKSTRLLDRVEIKGYADRHPADDCSSLWNFKQSNLAADNWNLLLSSLRAMSVQEALIGSATKDVDQSTIDHRVRLLEAVGKGDLHPRDPDHPDDSRDRRVEILVHFIESNIRSTNH